LGELVRATFADEEIYEILFNEGVSRIDLKKGEIKKPVQHSVKVKLQ